MTKDEYKQKKIDLEDEYEKKKQALAKECALSNNTYKIGDLFTDHNGTIRIKKIQFTYGSFGDLPYCVYEGDNLLKSGQISKRDPIRSAHQCNDVNSK